MVSLLTFDFFRRSTGVHQVQIVGILERSLAPVAVVWRMLFVDMFSEPLFAAENPNAVFTPIPVLFLLVRQAELSVVGRPSSVAPAAFNLVRMRVAVVEVLAESLRFKRSATAFVHYGRRPKMKMSTEM